MAKTFNLELQTRPTKQGYYPVWVRITENRKHRRIKTSVVLSHLTDWNPKAKDDRKVRQSEPNFKQLNEALEKELARIKKEADRDENKTLSIASVAQIIKSGEQSPSFLEFAKSKVEEAEAIESVGTNRHYQCVVKKLESYLAAHKRSDLLFSEIDVAFLKSFEKYLSTIESGRCKGRRVAKVTIASNLKKLRKLVNDALIEGKITPERYPFGRGKFVISGGSDTSKEKLDEAEMQRIIDLDLAEGSAEWNTRNAFLFSFYCAGIRAGDLIQLRWENVEEGRLKYKMDKTGKVRDYELVAPALAILDLYRQEENKPSDYIFPFLNPDAKWAIESYKGIETMDLELRKELFNQIASRNVILNRNLKSIAGKAEITKRVTFHTSRHSFANLAMKSQLPDKLTQKLLGHSSVKTTEGYMGNFNNAETDEALKKIFGKGEGQAQNNKKEAILEGLKNLDKETLVELLAKALTQNK